MIFCRPRRIIINDNPAAGIGCLGYVDKAPLIVVGLFVAKNNYVKESL
jgi:hypothetical protein